MKIRYNIISISWADTSAMSFFIIGIHLTFFIQIFTVLPEFYSPGTFPHRILFAFATFLYFNACWNLLFFMMTDTSIDYLTDESLIPKDEKEDWRFCEKCKSYAPPRSWHCVQCKTCILKRDHHSIFLGYCVGHRNHRYYLVLLCYTMFSTCIATLAGSIFFWWVKFDEHVNTMNMMKFVFPMLVFSSGDSGINIFLFNNIFCVVAIVHFVRMLVFNWEMLCKRALSYEKDGSKYDRGFWKNIETIFGRRWWLVWLSPFVSSELPYDGVHWRNELKVE